MTAGPRVARHRAGRHRAPPTPLPPLAALGVWRLGAGEELAERHHDEVDRDVWVERRLARRELGCLLLVVFFLLLRARYLD